MWVYTECRSCKGALLLGSGLPDPPERTDFWHGQAPCKPVIYRREQLELDFGLAAQKVNGAVLLGNDRSTKKFAAALERIEAELKAIDEQPPKLLESAVQYARWGWLVFPLVEGTKLPTKHSNGFLDATTDVVKIQAYWSAHPTANIGIATGHVFDVIDVDTEKITPSGARKPSGFPAFEKALAAADPKTGKGPLPDCYGIARTPSGGLHLLLSPTGAANTEATMPGVDYRGRGGYIVAAPSQIDGARYRWWIPPAPQVKRPSRG